MGCAYFDAYIELSLTVVSESYIFFLLYYTSLESSKFDHSAVGEHLNWVWLTCCKVTYIFFLHMNHVFAMTILMFGNTWILSTILLPGSRVLQDLVVLQQSQWLKLWKTFLKPWRRHPTLSHQLFSFRWVPYTRITVIISSFWKWTALHVCVFECEHLYIEVPRDTRNSLKYWCFELIELAPSDGQTKGNQLDFEIVGISN